MRRPDIVDHIFNSSRVLSFTPILELTDIPSLSLPKKKVSTPSLEPLLKYHKATSLPLSHLAVRLNLVLRTTVFLLHERTKAVKKNEGILQLVALWRNDSTPYLEFVGQRFKSLSPPFFF